MSCGVGHRHSSDLVLLWLWCRPVATAPVRPLVWELPYATGVALKRQKQNKNKTNKKKSLKKNGALHRRGYAKGKEMFAEMLKPRRDWKMQHETTMRWQVVSGHLSCLWTGLSSSSCRSVSSPAAVTSFAGSRLWGPHSVGTQ